MRDSRRIRITGIVQGVGFRPFVYACAKKHGIAGFVTNTPEGVEIVAQGEDDRMNAFESEIASHPPAHSSIATFDTEHFDPLAVFTDFEIRTSRSGGEKSARISGDLPICDACVSELLDPSNRRYYYPYINCSHCGPRYTIVKDIPYDRKLTTMSAFAMCGPCHGEYTNPDNRRFHAQPNACFECGPVFELCDEKGTVLESTKDPDSSIRLFSRLRSLIEQGSIVAIKGIGGFHLACDATNDSAVRTLRSRKYREAKPFAVMAASIAHAEISEPESRLLCSDPRPIVLIGKKPESVIAEAVAPRTDLIGIMLPHTPLHYLLFDGFARPLVMTSANMSDEPIAYTDEDALARLGPIADYFLLGNRAIHTRCDDSVSRIVLGKEYVLRRSRGYVPNPVALAAPLRVPVIALGSEQKNTICIGSGSRAILSHHIGDLDNLAAFRSFEQNIPHLAGLFDIKPALVAYDLHPEYHNTKYLFSDRIAHTLLDGLPVAGVQHHHAHIVSCMTEHGITGDVIGLALDGTGWGPDGTVWGGEIMLANDRSFTRLGSLLPLRMPGGAISIRKPWRMALSYLVETFGNEYKKFIPHKMMREIREDEFAIAEFQLSDHRVSPLTSSCGRLFDTVAALTSVCIDASYEGEPAIELEQSIDPLETSSYDFSLEWKADFLYISWKSVIENIVADLSSGKPVSFVSAKFHNGLAEALVEASLLLSHKTGVKRIVASGGVFMNASLLSRCASRLANTDLELITHSTVPCNDGGVSLGQAVIAANNFG
jgi:hydrogenase maturation protein HypF